MMGARLMREMRLESAVRGRLKRTTVSDEARPCPRDRVNREFWAERPNKPRVADFTYVATWAGFVHVAFVVEVVARRIVRLRFAGKTLHRSFSTRLTP
jgi:transposase InsO family protein